MTAEDLNPYDSYFRPSIDDNDSGMLPANVVTRLPPLAQGGGVTPPPSSPSTLPSGAAGAPKAQPPKRRVKRILLWVLVVVVTYIVALVAVFALSVGKVDAMPTDQIGGTSGTNYLLVGSDGRQELTPEERKTLHVGSVEGDRTDTIMLLHVPALGQPTLISIPRDSWVPIPGHGEDKINAAFGLGGPQLLIETVENATGVHVDNYVEIGMVGVARMSDAVGGITLCPERRYNDEKSNLKVKAGCQEMDGPTSLAYVRMRYSDPKGDLGRQERQQEYISAMARQTMSPLTWLNPFKMFSMASTAGQSLTVDEDTGIFDDVRMAMAMGMISMGWGESETVPVATADYWVGGQQAVKWDTPAAEELFRSIGADV